MHITVLGELMDDFENLNTFTEYESILEPVFHTFCLIYSRSQYYNKPKRIIALMQVMEWCRIEGNVMVWDGME